MGRVTLWNVEDLAGLNRFQVNHVEVPQPLTLAPSARANEALALGRAPLLARACRNLYSSLAVPG